MLLGPDESAIDSVIINRDTPSHAHNTYSIDDLYSHNACAFTGDLVHTLYADTVFRLLRAIPWEFGERDELEGIDNRIVCDVADLQGQRCRTSYMRLKGCNEPLTEAMSHVIHVNGRPLRTLMPFECDPITRELL